MPTTHHAYATAIGCNCMLNQCNKYTKMCYSLLHVVMVTEFQCASNALRSASCDSSHLPKREGARSFATIIETVGTIHWIVLFLCCIDVVCAVCSDWSSKCWRCQSRSREVGFDLKGALSAVEVHYNFALICSLICFLLLMMLVWVAAESVVSERQQPVYDS